MADYTSNKAITEVDIAINKAASDITSTAKSVFSKVSEVDLVVAY